MARKKTSTTKKTTARQTKAATESKAKKTSRTTATAAADEAAPKAATEAPAKAKTAVKAESQSTAASATTSGNAGTTAKSKARTSARSGKSAGSTRAKAGATTKAGKEVMPRNANNNGHAYDAADLNGGTLTTAELRKAKSGLTRKDMNLFRQLLLEKRAELVGDVESLQADARNGGGGISYEHMADVGTDSYEQEFALGLAESERKILQEIDDALGRMRDGYYGVCVATGKPIGKPRLEIKPWAKYCIEIAREREKRGLG